MPPTPIITTDTPGVTRARTDSHTISLYVANQPGVLARIAQTFARRGFNIDSLVVSPGRDGRFSRMTIGATGEPEGLDQILQQCLKLVDVVQALDHTHSDCVQKELGLIKLSVASDARAEALQIAEHFGCKTVDLTETSMVLQVTGDTEKIDALLRLVAKFGILELVRTGKVLMVRGEELT